MARTEVRGGQILDASVSLTADVTGTLPVANGGTGAATQNANSVLLGNGTGALQNIAPSTSGNVLTSDGTTWASVASGGRLTGEITAYGGKVTPTGWLRCSGITYSRTTYAALFAVLCPSMGTVTMTIASPTAVTLSAHGFVTGDSIYLTTTGALPTGLAQNTLYYVTPLDANSFRLATSRANANSGTFINTSGSQSGVHTLRACPYGLGDGSTTFNIPDLRGRVIAGPDNMDSGAASRLSVGTGGGTYGVQGAAGGEQTHQLSVAEMPVHNHALAGGDHQYYVYDPSAPPNTMTSGAPFGMTTTFPPNAGGDAWHNTVQPTLVMNYIIKT